MRFKDKEGKQKFVEFEKDERNKWKRLSLLESFIKSLEKFDKFGLEVHQFNFKKLRRVEFKFTSCSVKFTIKVSIHFIKFK